MKTLFLPLLALVLSSGLAQSATAQARPKVNVKRAFAHSSEAGKGKANKAHFRRENEGGIRPTIDLNPRSLERTKTVKAPKHYKFAKGA